MLEAMKLIHSDPDVKSIFVNIFGGILRCDLLVESIINAHKQEGFTKPIVLRLKGTNSDIAAKMMEGKEEELGITFTTDFDFGAREAVKAA